jgi:sensor domain CHASE-containing protein
MNLREKTVIIIGITLAGLVMILYAASQVIIMGSFTELEEYSTCQNVERVQNSLSNELDKMDRICYDWAAWDDTYAFIRDRNTDYIESNLVDSTFVTLNLNLMLFVDSSGSVVFGKAVNLEDEVDMEVPQSLLEHISVNRGLLDHDDVQSSITGVILLFEGPLLVSSRPVLTSDDEGPIRGTLIMGRYFDDAEIEHLEEVTQLSLAAYIIGDTMPPDCRTAAAALKEDAIFVQAVGQETVAGYSMVEDIYKNPVILLRAAMPRDIYEHGLASMRYFMLSLLAAGLVFGVVIMLLLENQVLSRLTYLSKSVSSISAHDDLAARVLVKGKDELSNLADEINQMIGTIEQSHKKLQGSVEEKEVLLKEIHHRVKNNMQIISSLLSLQSTYIRDSAAREIFKESQNRVKSMALIHEKLYHSKSLANVDIDEYVRDLTADLVRSYGAGGKVTLKIDVGDISLGVDTAIPCGLIINELVSNSLKHAFPHGEGEVHVRVRSVGNRIELTVADNGVGMPDTDFKKTETLGLRLVVILVEDQLNGEIKLESNGGTAFCITFRA